MGKMIKGLVGLSFAAYCAVSAVWLGKNMNYLDKLNHSWDDDKDSEEDEQPGKFRKKFQKKPKYFTVYKKTDDSE